MLRLLSLSLTNIGPFRDQTRTVDFRKGSFLVKAPIGSGKSFLYFDGPTYALYKKSKLKNGRDMLNMDSKTGQICCSFEIDGVCYTIQRDFKRTKSIQSSDESKKANTGESVKSKLFLHRDADNCALADAEVIDFKNEADLQQTLLSLLPPFEVFLSTQMLVQDSENIFELESKNRIEVFKNVFGLLGIDDIKDRIADRKRDVSSMIKARADLSHYNEKTTVLIGQLVKGRTGMQEIIDNVNPETAKDNTFQIWDTTIGERSLLLDKMTIEGLSLPQDIDFANLLANNDEISTQIITLQTQAQGLHSQDQHIAQEITKLQQQQLQSQKTLTALQDKLSNHDPRQIEILNQKLHVLQTQRETIEHTLSQDTISSTIKTLSQSGHHIFSEIVQDARSWYLANDKKRSYTIVQKIIAQLIAGGKECKHQMQLQTQDAQHREIQTKELQQQLQSAQTRINDFQHDIAEQKIFHCQKIQDACPYIDMINTATFRQLDKQLQSFIQERDNLQAKLKVQQHPDNSKTSIKERESLISLISTSLNQLERKQVDTIIQEITTLQQETEQTQHARQILHRQAQEIQSLQEQAHTTQTVIGTLSDQLQSLQTQHHAIIEQHEILRQRLSNLPSHEIITQQKSAITHYQKTIDQLTQLIQDYKSSQLEVQQLKEDEKILSDLYQVFAKELLLVVVQKNLPLLQDLMNSYLSQVVDYQLQMDIDKKSARNDNIELFVTILDEKGRREVKSLSGGQKVILKIVWMMAIANLTRSKMLFLDETINNLDGDTVAKVAELLKNFIEGRGKDFMLYIVTHSAQIQEMSIWDEVIEIRQDQD